MSLMLGFMRVRLFLKIDLENNYLVADKYRFFI